MACALWPGVLPALGIADYGPWYLDSYAVLAANDAVRAGISPEVVNPLDPLLRNHKYSDWWLAMRWFGLTRESNFLVGTAWVVFFALAALLTAKPDNYPEAFWLAGLLLAPPVLLAVNRANNDLVIFALLAVCGSAASSPTWSRQLLAIGLLALAAGLKYYPAVAAGAFLLVRPVRRAPWVASLALLAAVLVLAGLWPQLARGRFEVESTLHTFGAALLGREFGWSDIVSALVFLMVSTAGAAALVATRCTRGLAQHGGPQERILATIGCLVLLGCFAAGLSYAYRWIFALWMAVWLRRRAFDSALPARDLRAVYLTTGLLVFCFWSDGLLCLTVNRILSPVSPSAFGALESHWRLFTQPLHWLLMILLAGWVLEAFWATFLERKEATNSPSPISSS